jgi:hypothetical protein
MAHDRRKVAIVKGALMAGLGPKLIAAWTGIPAGTIQEWSAGECQAAVPPDESVANDLRDVLMSRFLGRNSTR